MTKSMSTPCIDLCQIYVESMRMVDSICIDILYADMKILFVEVLHCCSSSVSFAFERKSTQEWSVITFVENSFLFWFR
jgi:hypothetical protein